MFFVKSSFTFSEASMMASCRTRIFACELSPQINPPAAMLFVLTIFGSAGGWTYSPVVDRVKSILYLSIGFMMIKSGLNPALCSCATAAPRYEARSQPVPNSELLNATPAVVNPRKLAPVPSPLMI